MVYKIPVLVVRYFPAKGDIIDNSIVDDVIDTVAHVRDHTLAMEKDVIEALEKGSTYHGYKNPQALPSLHYEIVDHLEFLEPVPVWHKLGDKLPMTDYNAIMKRIDIRTWVEERGVREVWIWGYQGIDIGSGLWESNMAGPYGDISNSECWLSDLPVLNHTYTVYHYNYGRDVPEAVEDHVHQIERLLGHVDRHMFWDLFVGDCLVKRWGNVLYPTDRVKHCGDAHYPPNGTEDYDWNNKLSIRSDIETWKPEGKTPSELIDCERWNIDRLGWFESWRNSLDPRDDRPKYHLGWFVYWMQNLPGADNGLTYQGKPLTNWWMFVGDFDAAMAQGRGLVAVLPRYRRVSELVSSRIPAYAGDWWYRMLRGYSVIDGALVAARRSLIGR
jgi:hypothetical protein